MATLEHLGPLGGLIAFVLGLVYMVRNRDVPVTRGWGKWDVPAAGSDRSRKRRHRKSRSSGLERIVFFIPKTIREPWIGDLREDWKRMYARGHGRAFVTSATITQFALLVLRFLAGLIKDIVTKVVEGVMRSAT